jgi:Protein of unknown function (DUF3891)
MLIQREDGMLVVVRQTDHMAQVAQIAEVWGNADFPAPEHREETIRAAALHDNGWRDWEEHPTLVPETGRPRNLGDVETAVHATFYRAGVERAVAIDPYTGLLVSMHATALYAGVDRWDPQTLTPPTRDDLSEVERSFIARQAAVQRRLREDLATSPRYARSVAPARLWPAYLRLRAWDRLSLYFVYFGLGDGYLDHVPTADGEATVGLRQIGPRSATADPWPFDRDAVAFPVVTVRVPDRHYDDGEEFLHVLANTEPEVQEFTMRSP